MKTLCILIAMVLLAGCAAPRLDTASGRPEVTVNATKAKVRALLIKQLVDRGYLVVNETESMIQMEGDAGGAADFWFTNTLSGERPKTILRLNVIDTGGGIRVLMTAKLWRPTYRAELDITNRDGLNRLQWFLDCMAAELEGRSLPPEPPKPPTVPANSPKSLK